MKKDTNIIFRINSKLKDSVSNIAKEKGTTLSEVITACLKDIARKKSIPLSVSKYLEIEDEENNITISIIKSALAEVIINNSLNKIRRAFLFGSYARGDENNKSDIDIRIEADEGLSLSDISCLRENLEQLTGKDVDLLVISPRKLDTTFQNNLKKDEICIFEK